MSSMISYQPVFVCRLEITDSTSWQLPQIFFTVSRAGPSGNAD